MILILSLIFLIVDQISKILVVKFLDLNSVAVIKNFFYLTYTNNTGAAFSILTDKRIFLVLVGIIIIILLIYYLKKHQIKNTINKIAFALVIGGSLGNLIDRIIRGSVVDFIDIKIFSYNFPIFNLADTFITIGVLLLLININKEETK